MKKQMISFLAMMAIACGSFAQSAMYLPVLVKNNDGATETYNIQKGDQLIYQVSANGAEYDFVVTVNAESDEDGIDFNYEMTNRNNTKGHVMITADARKSATKYTNYFKGGELILTDASTVWLSEKNFSDMAQKKTIMQLDNGSPETFFRSGEDEVNPEVKIKGAYKKLAGFQISNSADGEGTKTMWVNDISSNSLILKMDLGWTIILKEIR